MVKRCLKAQLWVLLCGGPVGPVYLIVYYKFTSPDDRHFVGWVYWAGWAITAADVLIALLLTSHRTRSAAKSAATELDGVLALAQITGMAETGMSINDQPVVKLSLHIAGPGFAFDTTKRVTASVTRMGNLSAGKLVVLVAPATHDFEVDWQRSALVNGLAAARFTVTEDNKTYDLTGQAGPLLEILRLLQDNNVPLNGPLDLRSADPTPTRPCASRSTTWCAGRRRPSLPRHSPGRGRSPTRQGSRRHGPPPPSGCRNWPGCMRTRRSPTPSTRRSGGRSSRRSEDTRVPRPNHQWVISPNADSQLLLVHGDTAGRVPGDHRT